MNRRQLFLLSPYQVPAHHPLVLSHDDAAAFLNGYAALWHPAVLRGADGPPQITSPFNHENPTEPAIFAVPESPPPMLPSDWRQRALDFGSVVVSANADREATLAMLVTQLGDDSLTTLPPERVWPFLGIGFGWMMVNALYDAMEHENLLPVAEVWQDVQDAVAKLDDDDAAAFRGPLQAAAEKLLAAREVLYPVAIHIVDIRPLGRFEHGLPVNLVASAEQLAEFGRLHPDVFAELRERVSRDVVEVIGGYGVDRADDLLPLVSQLWNLRQGRTRFAELLGTGPRVAARSLHGFSPQAALVLANAGMFRAVQFAVDSPLASEYASTVVAFTAPDGRQIDVFNRVPYAADDANVFLHLAHYLHKTIMQDHAATLALARRGERESPWYRDWVELTQFAPVLGQWTTLSRYLSDVSAGEYASTLSPDDQHDDELTARVDALVPSPISAFISHPQMRRRLDAVYTFAGFLRGLGAAPNCGELDRVEAGIETGGVDAHHDLALSDTAIQQALTQRLLSRAQTVGDGYLVLNPCGFTRRVALELPPVSTPIPVEGPVKAFQTDADACRVVVETPGLGFAWFPKFGAPGTPPMRSRMRLADDRHVRNEFFEAEMDAATGGLRGIRDHHSRTHRLGEQLVFNPGSYMRATSIQVVSSGPALGEVVSTGELVAEHGQLLATFRQRFRAWLGRPVLEMRIDIEPTQGPSGYPWHAYYAARFAWRDERALLLRGINGTAYVTSHTRPVTPDFLELRQGRQNTVVFPCGLPFHQRHGTRMLDIILIVAGEHARTFNLAIAIDRDHPMLTAQGLLSPTPCVSVANGPPHIGASGWLFHLDSPNVLLLGLRPIADTDALEACLLECGQHGGQTEMRFPRPPIAAELRDAAGHRLRDVFVDGDRAAFEIMPGELVYLRADF